MITNPDHSYLKSLVKTNPMSAVIANSQILEMDFLTAVLSSAACKLGEFSSEMDMHSES